MSSISGICRSGSAISMQGMQRQRPDPAKIAEQLFAKLDTAGQGYLEKADLQSAFNGLGNASSDRSSQVDELFSQLDGDSDGKVTKDEFSSALKKVAEQLDQQFMSLRLQGGANGTAGMPPPPPPGGNDAGFSQEELSRQLNDIGASDSQRAGLINKVLTNFDQADSDGDGKLSFKEAQAYDQASRGDSSSSVQTASQDGNLKMMQQIMELMRAYSLGGETGQQSNALTVAA